MNSAKSIPQESIAPMRSYLNSIHPRYAIIFDIGLESGLRISDILALKASSFPYRRKPVNVEEQKTGKTRCISFSSAVYKRVRQFIVNNGLAPTDYIAFRSYDLRSKAISRSQAYRMIRAAAKRLKLRNISPHSLRKTYARNLFLATGDIEVVRKELNHRYSSTTLLYIFGSPEEMAAHLK